MKDIFGREIQIGDLVAFNPPYYKGLVIGKIIKFNHKTVTVEYIHSGFLVRSVPYPSDVCVCLERREE